MSITDELREYAEDWGWLDTSSKEAQERIEAIADRIDAEHGKAIASVMNDALYYANDKDMAELGWVRLPVDADGEPIHIGDEMEGVDKYDSLKKVMGKVITVRFESDGAVDVAIQAWSSDGKSWHRAYLDPDASVYRHHHEPTVEDVLREFAVEVCGEPALTIRSGVVEEYASRLRLAGES